MNGISIFLLKVYVASANPKRTGGRDSKISFKLAVNGYEILSFVKPGKTAPNYMNL
jgi:hypothetical protein